MNIFVTRFINETTGTDYISTICHKTHHDATIFAEECITRWKDKDTYEIIEYTPVEGHKASALT